MIYILEDFMLPEDAKTLIKFYNKLKKEFKDFETN